jgi:putative membrane protein insertion efficiency factor
VKRLLLVLFAAYRRRISPLLPDRCRYYPSCSAYASEAIERFGAGRGMLLAAWRLLRCNPLSDGGIDPVPETFTLRRHRSPSQVARSSSTSE